jgi:hypothetical protein
MSLRRGIVVRSAAAATSGGATAQNPHEDSGHQPFSQRVEHALHGRFAMRKPWAFQGYSRHSFGRVILPAEPDIEGEREAAIAAFGVLCRTSPGVECASD